MKRVKKNKGKSKVFCLGELLLDVFSKQITTDYTKIKSFIPLLGGGSANVATCLARQNVPSAFISLVGVDQIGEMLIGKLEENGVDTSYIKRTDKLFSGVVFITRDEKKERYFLAVPPKPSCLAFDENDITPDFLSDCSFLHFGSSNLVYPKARKATLNILKVCKAKNIPISFDLNLRPGNWPGFKVNKRVIASAMKYAAVIKANDEELHFVTGQNDFVKAAQKLAESIPLIMLSRGEKGALAITKNDVVKMKAGRVKVEDTTGAGDAFCAGYIAEFKRLGISYNDFFTSGIAETQLKPILKSAVRLGGLVTRKVGAVEACPFDKMK